jgi:hypothetical protein
VEREHDAHRRGDKRMVIRLSGEFHTLLAELAGNSALARITRELCMLTCLTIFLYDAPTAHSCREDEHQAIVDAVARRDRGGPRRSCWITSITSRAACSSTTPRAKRTWKRSSGSKVVSTSPTHLRSRNRRTLAGREKRIRSMRQFPAAAGRAVKKSRAALSLVRQVAKFTGASRQGLTLAR